MVVDGDIVVDLDMPGDDDFDGGVDADAFADFGTKEAEHGVSKAGHGGGAGFPEEELADSPEGSDDFGFEGPGRFAWWLLERYFRRGCIFGGVGGLICIWLVVLWRVHLVWLIWESSFGCVC